MSTSYSKVVEYKCFNDCNQYGCRGHKLRAVHHNTSDVLIVEIDGKNEYWFDYNMMAALQEALKEGR